MHLWSEKFDREVEDVFAIQDEISLCYSGSPENQIIRAKENSDLKTSSREIRSL